MDRIIPGVKSINVMNVVCGIEHRSQKEMDIQPKRVCRQSVCMWKVTVMVQLDVC
jgi:hypothetical protein